MMAGVLDFTLIGAAGFVAPRHMKAIKDTGNQLVSVFDIHDALGVMDSYFPDAQCFGDLSAYDRFHRASPPDLVSVCSPNDLHFEHIALGLSWGADVICEKPMVLDPAQLEDIKQMELSTGRKVYTILQLRLLDVVQQLKERVVRQDYVSDVEVSYISARGNWYFNSWKGNNERSGGLVTNIGIHLFDLLLWVFGSCSSASIISQNERTASGSLSLEKARVRWKLSVDPGELPPAIAKAGGRTFRQMTVDGLEIRLDEGLDQLHTLCYREILSGKGNGIEAAEPSIRLCRELRSL